MLQGLYRRSSGIYAVRITVPKKLRPLIGKCEIHVTTGLRELKPATVCALKIQLLWQEKLMAMDIEQLRAGSPALLIPGKIPLTEASQHLGMEVNSLLSICNDRYSKLYTTLSRVAGWAVNSLGEIERDYDGNFITNDVERVGIQVFHSGELQLYDSRTSVEKLMESGTAEESVFKTHSGGGFFPEELVKLSLSSIKIERKDVEAIRHTLVERLPALSKPHDKTPIEQPQTIRKGKYVDTRFSEVFELLKNDRDWGKAQLQRMETEAGLFTDLMNDPKLCEIDKSMIQKFAEYLSKLPNQISRNKRKYNIVNTLDLIDISKRDGIQTKEPQTIKNHIGKISEILTYALHGGMIDHNPASGYKKGKKIANRVRAQDERDIFTLDELNIIFSQPWFLNGKGNFNSKDFTHWRPYYYWLPILSVFSGGRLNELSQLYVSDIKKSEDSNIWYIDFNLSKPDKIDADNQEKSLKTINSIRTVPIHSFILSLGFIEYVELLKSSGYSRLFPELKHDPIKGYGKPAGSWFNERLLGNKLKIERNNKKTFHSFRHCFITQLERLNLTSTVMGQLAGHEKGKNQSSTRYAKDRSAAELAKDIERIDLDYTKNIKPFNSQAGLKAIRVALNIKKHNTKRSSIK